jgi:hypothetical protein
MKLSQWILGRAQERSTYLGIIGILTGAGFSIKPELGNAVISLGLGIAGVVGVITKDKNVR